MTTTRTLKMAMIGIGVGGAEMLPAMEAMPEIDLVAGADIRPKVRDAFAGRYEARPHDSIEALCADPNVEAVWVSTPNRFHAAHAIYAMEHGKHVVVEKPMALTLEDAQHMVETSHRTGMKLVAGHTRSFIPEFRMMWRIINSGELGRVHAIHFVAYTDWMIRPRSAEEQDINQGGGVVFRQGPHQIDTVRLLGGGLLRSVRANVGQWMPGVNSRQIPGYYSAFLEFEDGTPSTIVYNGYGYFMGAQMVSWSGERGLRNQEARISSRKAMQRGERDEEGEKEAIRIGGEQELQRFQRQTQQQDWVPGEPGWVVVSCDKGDLTRSARGIYIDDDDGRREMTVTHDRAMGPSARRAELEELYDAVVNGEPVYHTGEWGMATLEVCLAINQSAQQRREIQLHHQIATPANYGGAKIFAQETT